MAEAVYILCAATSLLCTFLLWRGYRRTKAKLLFWSSACFVAFAVNNILLVFDLMVYPQLSLQSWRSAFAAVGITLMIYGLIWNTREV